MINLLFSVVFTEMTLILILLFRSPIRKLMIAGIDELKRGKGPLVARTVAATILVVFSAVIYNVTQIHRRALEAGTISSTDEVLMAERLLEASLMGFSLFLALMIDRLHNYIKELHLLREELIVVKRLSPRQENLESRGGNPRDNQNLTTKGSQKDTKI